MLDQSNRMLIAKNDKTELFLLPQMANRHGLVTGATGTGKTISLQVLAESFSRLGVPVLVTDIKGDVSGISQPGGGNPKVDERVKSMSLAAKGFGFRGAPVCFWDVFGRDGHPLRSTISEMGPLLLSRVLDLNDTQTGVMQVLFRIADDGGLLLLDLKDIRKLVEYVTTNKQEFAASYGNLATASLGAIQRNLLTLEEQGGDIYFAEPSLEVKDLVRCTDDGLGVVNILAADKLMQFPRTYAAFLLGLLSELYEYLPEAGDLPLPKFILFFDEAHLIFKDAPKVLLERIEQVVRLIRSKSVGVYFITQSPADIPETVLAQLQNRIQHALRAYTPKEQRAVKAAADSFRPNPAFKTEEAICALGTGEALVSFLDPKGIPNMVERAFVLPPEGHIGAISQAERTAVIAGSAFKGKYDEVVDPESAYEILTARIETKGQQQQADLKAQADARAAKIKAAEDEKAAKIKAAEEARAAKAKAAEDARAAKAAAIEEARQEREKAKEANQKGFATELVTDLAKKTTQSLTRNISNQIGRTLLRGILGGIFGGKK